MTATFFLHAAATGDTGTLPATSATVSTDTATQTPSLTNRSMNGTIGTSQTSAALTTLANASTAQQSPILRFLSDPIAAQTIAGQVFTVKLGASESNTNSNFFICFTLALWRPSTGAVVARLYDTHTSGLISVTTTGELAYSQGGITTAVTSQDGDVLVLELWRDATLQGMATSYSNTIFYDGTTEASATTNAALLRFTNDVAMFTGAAAVIPDVNMAPMIGG